MIKAVLFDLDGSSTIATRSPKRCSSSSTESSKPSCAESRASVTPVVIEAPVIRRLEEVLALAAP
jgi:hypothetical protein